MSEIPSLYTHAKPKARKEHRCCECRGRIYRGEVYRLHRGLWCGCWETYKVCADCEALRAEVDRKADPNDQPALGDLGWAVAEIERPDLLEQFRSIVARRGSKLVVAEADIELQTP